jgi:plasmid stabilization system protein ParE
MKYRVVIEDSAQVDLEDIVLWLAEHSQDAARQWYWRVKDAIHTLCQFPLRCPLAPENKTFQEEIRQLFHGRKPHVYRILFTVRGSTVHVLHIRHGARNPLKPEEEA